MEKPETKLQAGDIPARYAVCYNHQCPRADECLRHLCYTLLPADVEVRPCVLPQAWEGHECRQFAQAGIVQLAWGMTHLFDDVPSWQATGIRRELIDLIGSHSTYFRYRRGEFIISPELQRQVADIFRKHGFTEARRYDVTRQAHYFDVPGFGSNHAYNKRHTKERLSKFFREASGSAIV